MAKMKFCENSFDGDASVTFDRLRHQSPSIWMISSISVCFYRNLLRSPSHSADKKFKACCRNSLFCTLQLFPLGSQPVRTMPGCFFGKKSAKQAVELKNPQVLENLESLCKRCLTKDSARARKYIDVKSLFVLIQSIPHSPYDTRRPTTCALSQS